MSKIHMETISLTEKAYTTLKDAITTGLLKPGELLNERGLAERFDLSKTPVRESLQVLQKEGLVNAIPRAGYMVTHLTLRQIQQWFQVRLILESAAVELAAAAAPEGTLMQLEERSLFSYTHGDRDSYREFLRQNTAFHYQVALASGNPALAGMLLQVLEKLERAFHLELGLRDSAAEMTTAHHRLVQALRARDASGARTLVKEEISSSQQRITEALSMNQSVLFNNKEIFE